MAPIKTRIIISFTITLLTIFGIIGIHYINLLDLGHMQSIASERAQNAADIKETSMTGLGLYHIIADAMIVERTKLPPENWAAKKEEALYYVDLAIQLSDTDEEDALAEEVSAAVQNIINLFELRLLPLLESSENKVPETLEVYKKIQQQVVKVESLMDRLVASILLEMEQSHRVFDQKIAHTEIQSLVIGLLAILLQVWLIMWLVRKNLDKKIVELDKATEKVKVLQGILPICMYCKEIRNDEGTWNRLEEYIAVHSEADFSHGICDKCMEEKHSKTPKYS